MSINLKEWYQKMQAGNVILAYKGSISPELITNVLDKIEEKLENVHENPKLRRKVYNILVEALQNLYHHLVIPPEIENEEEVKNGKFAIFVFSKQKNNKYKISTGNFIKRENYQMLKDRLDQINYLTSEELKVLYKLILNNNEFSAKGGGGLGIIDIARKSGNKFEYNFVNYNKNYYFFCLDIIV